MDDTNRVHTSTLLRGLFRTAHLKKFMEKQENAMALPLFSEYICELCRTRGMLRAEVIRRSGIDRAYGFQIFQGTKKPSRDKVLQLAIGFGMDYEETQSLLRAARQSALYPRFKRDAAIIYCINKRFDFMQTQQVLAAIDTMILGKEPSA